MHLPSRICAIAQYKQVIPCSTKKRINTCIHVANFVFYEEARVTSAQPCQRSGPQTMNVVRQILLLAALGGYMQLSSPSMLDIGKA